MKTFLRPLDIRNWPIRIKLLGGFALAVLIPSVVLLVIGWMGASTIGRQNIRTLITESGTTRGRLTQHALDMAFMSINAFVSDAGNRILMTDVIRAADLAPTERFSLRTPEAMAEIFETTFLSDPDSIIDSLWLLNPGGRVEALAFHGDHRPVIASGNREIEVIVGASITDSLAYRTAQDTVRRNQDRAIIFASDQEEHAIQVVHSLTRFEDEVAGYLVIGLDIEALVSNNLRFQDQSLPVYSFIALPTGGVQALPEYQTLAEASANSDAVIRALNQETGTDTYAIGGGEVVGHYRPIILPDSNRIMALVTQIDSNVAAQQVAGYLRDLAFGLLIGFLALILIMVWFYDRLLVPPLHNLRDTIHRLARGDFDHPVPAAARADEIGTLAATFVNMRHQMQNLTDDIYDQLVASRRDIEATQEISRFAATQRDLQTLMDQVVELIIERFPNIYHAQIFLIDEESNYAILRASSGKIGKELLARGHQLTVGSLSVIGQVTQNGQLIIARDTATSQVHRQNEFLIETRAELAIPLRFGEIVMGALDVQSSRHDSFDEQQTSVLQTMADQIAVAIYNARLYQESVQRLEEFEEANKRGTEQSWMDYVRGQRVGFLSSQAGFETDTDLLTLRQSARDQKQSVIGDITERETIPIAVPIQWRGYILGTVEWEIPAKTFDRNQVLLAEELVNRLAISLENARLFEESSRATERERLVNEIAAKVTGQTNIDEILQTAVREVGRALRVPQVNIHLDKSPGSKGNGDREQGNPV